MKDIESGYERENTIPLGAITDCRAEQTRPIINQLLLPVESDANFCAKHLNVLAVKALLDGVVHASQKLAAVNAGLCGETSQIDFIVLGLKVRATLASKARL